MRRVLTLLITVVLCASALSCIVRYEEPRRPPVARPTPPPPPPPPLGPTVGYFYDALDPWGDWVWSDSWGWVWSPSRVHASWRPYWDGRWVWTADGWYWLSDEPWSWAVYHYGRWTWAPGWGWVWIPGREWAPAWVAWRYGRGWIGWAPLPPGAVWSGGRLDVRVSIDVDRWCFVDERRFVEPRVGRHAVPVGRNVTLVRETRDTTRYAVEGNRVVNRSVEVERIREATRQEIPRWRVEEVDSHNRAGPGPEGSREVRVWRPPLGAPSSEAKPRRAAPGRIEREREDPAPPPAPRAPEARPTPPSPAPPPRPPAARPGRVARPRAVEPSAPEAERRRLEREQSAERERLERQQAEEARRAADEKERQEIEARQAEERRVQEAQEAREKRLLDARRRRAEAKKEKKEGEASEEGETPPR